MKKFKVILIFVIIAIAVIVALQNTESVDMKILWMNLPVPRMLLVLITFALGFLAGLITASLMLRKSHKEKKK